MGPLMFLAGIGVVAGGGWVWFNWDDPNRWLAVAWLVVLGLLVIKASFTNHSWPR